MQTQKAYGKEPRGDGTHERPSAEVAKMIQVAVEFWKVNVTSRRMRSKVNWPAAVPLSNHEINGAASQTNFRNYTH
jgi:hypothetical protein